MLAAPVPDPALLPGWAGEPKWDGFRAALSVDGGQAVLRSRRGAQMGPAFPEIVAGAAGWGTRETLDVMLVRPELVVEVAVDVARDASGRWRHPASWHRWASSLPAPRCPALSPVC
jgi:hypothetical protein